MRKQDKYDRAVAYLKKHPEHINFAWVFPYTYLKRGGELFKCVSGGIGCPTQISRPTFFQSLNYVAPTLLLTRRMRKDKRLQAGPYIKPDKLSVFAMYQRLCDKAAKKASR